MGEYVSVEARGNVALVRLDRPPANAMDQALLDEASAAAAQVARERPDAVVLTGRPDFFSAGVDLNVALHLDQAGQRAMVTGINRMIAGWYCCPRPVVTAVNGHAIAGGLFLALCGDWRVGTTQGRYGLTEARVGVPYPAVVLAVARAELAPPVLRRLMLRAHLLDAGEAQREGLWDEVVAPGDVLGRALERAEELAALPRRTYERVKQQLRGPVLAAVADALDGADPLAGDWIGDETSDAAAARLRQAAE
jgi:enoyl-CoA hydratase/carnithine racemase